jgi:hypothetical protein
VLIITISCNNRLSAKMLCAGYCCYGSATEMVVTYGHGVQRFTLGTWYVTNDRLVMHDTHPITTALLQDMSWYHQRRENENENENERETENENWSENGNGRVNEDKTKMRRLSECAALYYANAFLSLLSLSILY